MREGVGVADPFEALRRPVVPLAPRADFAAALRRRLEQETGMTTTGATTTRPLKAEGTLAMVHLRVADADRAMAFFGQLLGWEAERVLFEDHVSHFTVNTEVTVRILDDPDASPVRPNYQVGDVAGVMAAIQAAGGVVTASETTADGGGWAMGADDQGVPVLVYRPGGHRSSVIPTRGPIGDVGLVFIRVDAERAQRFYGATLGWELTRVHPNSSYFDAVPRVGVFDEAAAFGRPVVPSVTLYLGLAPGRPLAPVLARVRELGGHVGPAAHDMGPYYTAVCTDDQGTEFGLMSDTLD